MRFSDRLLDMLPGSHDLSRLSPGIYLMRTEAGLTVAKLVVVK
jgi:hypothetical protein